MRNRIQIARMKHVLLEANHFHSVPPDEECDRYNGPSPIFPQNVWHKMVRSEWDNDAEGAESVVGE